VVASGKQNCVVNASAAAALVVLARLDDVIDLEDHLAHLQQQTAAEAANNCQR
jgi:hypothetical protein